MKSHEGKYEGGDGFSLFYRYRVPPKPAGLVLLLHGYAEHSGRYEWVAEHLADAGFAVYAPDLRGHGASARAGALADLKSLEAVVRDIAALVPIAREALPDRPLFLLGHSMGGMLALLYALRRPDGLAGLVSSAASVQIPEYISPLLLRVSGLLSRLLPLFPAQPFDYKLVSRDPRVVQALEEDPLYYKGKIRARCGYQQLLGMREVAAGLPRLRLPLLVLHGSEDRVIAPKSSEMVFHSASSPDKTLKIFPGLWHEILNEPERQEVLDLIVSWLRRRLG